MESPPPDRISPKWHWLVIVLLVIGSGIGIWRWLTDRSVAETITATATRKGPPPRPVELVALQSGEVLQKIALLGQSEPKERATIRTRTSGVVKEVLFQPGEPVSKGAIVAILDDVDQRLALLEAQARFAQARSVLARLEVGTRPEIIAQRRAELAAAKAREKEAIDNWQRNQDLVKQGAVTERRLVETSAAVDTTKGQRLLSQALLAESLAGPTREEIAAQQAVVSAAQATVQQATVALSRTKVMSPLAGTVQTRQVSSGDFVERNSPLFTIVAGQQLDIFLEVPEEQSNQVQVGLPITLTTRALPQWQTTIPITALAPVANSTSRRQQIRVVLNNPPQGLLPGMAIEGNLTIPSNQKELVVTRDALTRQDDQWFVYTIESQKEQEVAQKIAVEVIADMGKIMAIKAPQLQPGTKVVSRGGDLLSNGTTVKVITPNRPSQKKQQG